MTPALAKSFDLKEKKGALVSQVFKGGPAEKAGIDQGDVILSFDGKEIADSKDLPRIVKYCQKDVVAIAQLLLRYKGEPLIQPEQVELVS